MSSYTNQKQSAVEILAPGGSMEGIRAAVNAGADAVYAGGRAFGARAYAQNPEQDGLFEAIDYCHLHGAKLYLTVNTLLKERELFSQLYDYLAPVFEHGVDAVLVQDFGVFHFLRRQFPDLPLHASTQMTITGEDGVMLLRDMGAERVVLSRELSLDEIRKIHSHVDVELETFVHGALCYCYSGQCLMSSLIGGRSGNRGRCAQPCRLPYDLMEMPAREGGMISDRNSSRICSAKGEQYLLSPKDICTLRLLPDLVDAGIVSLKIEGRMKSPEYAAGVTSLYRRYVDLYLAGGREGYHVNPEDERLLTQLFSRGPYSEGYYSVRNGRDMMVLKEQKKEKGNALRTSQEAVGRIHDLFSQERKIPVTGHAQIRSGTEMMLTVSVQRQAETAEVTVYGSVPQASLNRPADEDSVSRQLLKTGDTPFVFESLKIDLEEGLFIPLKELNVLRRSALDQLKEKILTGYRRNVSSDNGRMPENGNVYSVHPAVTASVCSKEQLEAVLCADWTGGIYLDLPVCDRDTVRRIRESGKKAYVIMPPVWREDTVSVFERRITPDLADDLDGFLLRSFDQIGYFIRKKKEIVGLYGGKELIADAGLYTWNSEARQQLRLLGITMDTVPYECTSHELAERGCAGSELVIYGFQTLMISAQCLTKTTTGCSRRPGLRFLRDRMGVLFPVKNDCSICTNTIYNSVPLVLTDLKEEISALDPGSVRFHFTIETGEQTARILNGAVPEKKTRGHFRKGVE